MAEITFTMPAEAAAWLEDKATQHGLSIGSLLRKSLARYLVEVLKDDCVRTPLPAPLTH
jgi:hypothetical protein